MKERIIIVGGPRRGKSTLALELVFKDALVSSLQCAGRPPIPIRCGDPLSKVKEPRAGVEYLPEGIPFSGDDGAAQWVADHWFPLPGPWVCEGHVMARALRRWLGSHEEYDARGIRKPQGMPADRIIVLDRPGFGMPNPRQDGMHAGVMKVWYGDPDDPSKPPIAPHFEAITEYR